MKPVGIPCPLLPLVWLTVSVSIPCSLPFSLRVSRSLCSLATSRVSTRSPSISLPHSSTGSHSRSPSSHSRHFFLAAVSSLCASLSSLCSPSSPRARRRSRRSASRCAPSSPVVCCHSPRCRSSSLSLVALLVRCSAGALLCWFVCWFGCCVHSLPLPRPHLPSRCSPLSAPSHLLPASRRLHVKTHVMDGVCWREQSGRTVWRVTDEERLVWSRGFAPRGVWSCVTVAVDVSGCDMQTCMATHIHTPPATRAGARGAFPAPRGRGAGRVLFTFTFTLEH